MKFLVRNFYSKCEQIRRKLRIFSHLQKKSVRENSIFCAVWDENDNDNEMIMKSNCPYDNKLFMSFKS